RWPQVLTAAPRRWRSRRRCCRPSHGGTARRCSRCGGRRGWRRCRCWWCPPACARAGRPWPRWAFAGGSLNQWHYLVDTLGLPPLTMATVAATIAAAMTAVVLLFRALALRGRPLAAAFAAPLAGTGLAWLGAAQSPHGTFGNIAYTQMDVPLVLQVAA